MDYSKAEDEKIRPWNVCTIERKVLTGVTTTAKTTNYMLTATT